MSASVRRTRESIAPVPDTGQTPKRAHAAQQGPKNGILVADLARERQRRHRQRIRSGRIQLTVECDMRLVEAMLAVGMVTEAESRCRADLAHAIEEALAEWTARALAAGG